MNLPPFYTVFCLLVLGMFVYSKAQGLDIGNTAPSSGGFHYVGTSSSFHK